MISYRNIADAIEHYQDLGYEYVEVPWVVGDEALRATLPPFVQPLWETPRGHLVGSAEQSFLQMMMDNTLPPGKYVAVTPCFRDETPDKTHQNWFLKVELINTADTSSDALEDLITDALVFFRGLSSNAYLERYPAELDPITAHPYAYDILSLNGIELGSYGIRQYKDHKWVYGTGCAEPRLSYVLSQEKNSFAER